MIVRVRVYSRYTHHLLHQLLLLLLHLLLCLLHLVIVTSICSKRPGRRGPDDETRTIVLYSTVLVASMFLSLSQAKQESCWLRWLARATVTVECEYVTNATLTIMYYTYYLY